MIVITVIVIGMVIVVAVVIEMVTVIVIVNDIVILKSDNLRTVIENKLHVITIMMSEVT